MTEIRQSTPAPRAPFAIPNPAALKLRLPNIFRASAPDRETHPEAAAAVMPNPALETLVSGLAGLQQQTALLGVCDDDLPVLLDLSDPAPGALLVASDDREQRLSVLRTLMQTAATLNSPRNVQFLVLSDQPEAWQDWLAQLDSARHCLSVENFQDASCERWLLKLSTWADQRRTGSINGPAVLLIVDDLSAATRLEYDARVNFDWLVKEGPAVRIWPVAAVSTEALATLQRWVRLFKSRILGPTLDPQDYRQCVELDDEELAMFNDPDLFAVRIQENWLKFRVPA